MSRFKGEECTTINVVVYPNSLTQVKISSGTIADNPGTLAK